MKAADTLALFLDMAVASKVVSKRSARTFVEDGMEKELYEPHARKSTLRFDEVRLEEVEGPSSKSSSKSSSTSQTDVDISTSAAERTETGTAGIDLDIGDGGDQIVASKAPKLAGDSDDAEPEGLSTRPYPPNFGIVVPGVYRSSYPQPQAYGFLQDLGLKTIITLVQKDFPPGYKSFITANGIRHHVFDMKGTKKEEIPIKTMKSILRLVLDRQNHPLLIHCNHGKHRTGCIVAVVRKLTGWELSMIVDEYKSYAEPKVRECDIKYITTFDLSTISNLFVKEPSWQLRARSFVRVSLFTTFVLVVWLFSGTRIVSHTPST